MEETNIATGGSNPLAFLDAKAPVEIDDNPAPEPPSDRARGPDGKFIGKAEADAPAPSSEPVAAPVAAEPAPTAEPAPAPAPAAATPTPPEPGHVPISAMLDEREKRQAAEARAKKVEDDLAALRAKQAIEPPPQRPEDPEAAREFDQARIDMRLYQHTREVSRRFAVKEYGPETVAKVQEWAAAKCDEDRGFNARLLSSDDPYELSVQEWKRDQLLATVKPDDLDDYLAWRAAKDAGTLTSAQPAPAPTLVAPPPPVSPPAPKSLVTAPSAGGVAHTPSGPGQAYDTLWSPKG